MLLPADVLPGSSVPDPTGRWLGLVTRAAVAPGGTDLLNLAEAVRNFSPASAEFASVPIEPLGYRVPGIGLTVRWDKKKAAIVNATRNLSRSFGAEGITANCVLPGLTDTEGVRSGLDEAAAATGRSSEELVTRILARAPIDTGRLGTSAEVAAAVAFLCSEQAAWITGAALNVDGGTVRSAF